MAFMAFMVHVREFGNVNRCKSSGSGEDDILST